MTESPGRTPYITDSNGHESREAVHSVTAQIRSWLAGCRDPADRGRRARELLMAVIPTATEYSFRAECDCLSAEEDAPAALRIADTVMVGADRISLALSELCERLRACGLRPLVLLYAPPRSSHDGTTPIREFGRDFELLDLEQFVATVIFRRAWKTPEGSEEMLADIIGTCGLRTTRFSA